MLQLIQRRIQRAETYLDPDIIYTSAKLAISMIERRNLFFTVINLLVCEQKLFALLCFLFGLSLRTSSSGTQGFLHSEITLSSDQGTICSVGDQKGLVDLCKISTLPEAISLQLSNAF